MAGNVRFELASASPEESGFSANYPNGQRGNYPGASLDRSGSFREGGEGQMFNSGTGLAWGNATSTGDLPSLSQCLTLEPITMGDQKYTHLGELRRALGFPIGSTAGDNSFGAAHAKPPRPVAFEELKRLKASVAEASTKARVRTKMFDEALDGVNKYYESRNSKKHQPNELFRNERSGGSNLLKFGTQIQRNPPDLVTQRLEDRTKNGVLNKRVRTSKAQIQVHWDEPASILRPDRVSPWELEPFVAATPSNSQAAQRIKRARPPVLLSPSVDLSLSVIGMAGLPTPLLEESISSMTPTPYRSIRGMAALSTPLQESSICSESICSN